jgi:hypothetical protein
MHIGLHVEYPLFLSDFNENKFDRFSKKTVNTKFHENPSWESSCPMRRDMTKPTDAFRNFQNAPNELSMKFTNLKPFRRCCVRNTRAERILYFRFEVSRKIMKLDGQNVTTVTSSRCPTQHTYRELNKTGKCTHKRNIEVRSCNNCCRGKAISITYSECVCSFSYPACFAI